jgi:hypothetical protein
VRLRTEKAEVALVQGGPVNMQLEKQKANVVALNAQRNIYMVVDERNYSIGTGTKEVCQFLAELISKSLSVHQFEPRRAYVRDMGGSNVRSAIRI